MKKIILALVASATLAFAATTIPIKPGESVEIRAVSSPTLSIVRDVANEEAREVVKALEILLKYAPSKYDESVLSMSSGTGYLVLNSNAYVRKTKADELRSEATELVQKAKDKRERAAEMDKEQADIEWARGVLAKWKERLR